VGTPRTRRRLSPEERRAELIDAAIRLLRSGQPVSNWAQAVTVEADAAKGTFYLYFSSWDDMLVAVRDRVQQEYVTRFRGLAESPEQDWWAVLDAECDAAIDFIAQPSGLHHAVFHSVAVLAPTDDDVDIIGAIARFIGRGIEEGAFRAVDTRAAAAFLFAVVHAAADAIAAGEAPGRWRASVRDLTRSWLGRTDG
jgi:AcrR family transcriptional regulator